MSYEILNDINSQELPEVATELKQESKTDMSDEEYKCFLNSRKLRTKAMTLNIENLINAKFKAFNENINEEDLMSWRVEEFLQAHATEDREYDKTKDGYVIRSKHIV